MKGKNYRIIITELNMARDKIKYKDKYLKYAGVFFFPSNEESESQKLISTPKYFICILAELQLKYRNSDQPPKRANASLRKTQVKY